MTHRKREGYDFLSRLPEEPRGRTTERVERVLREAVVSLDFSPGEFMDKALICKRLGVSRFPVSEALARLAAEGLVEILPQRGTRAARISLADVREAMLIRRALEGTIAEMAARDLPEAALRLLEENLCRQARAVEAGDRIAFYTEDLAFHDLLVVELGLVRMAGVIEASRANVDRVRRLLSSPRRHALTLEEHRVVLAALAARDAPRARQAMEAHLDAVMEELVTFARENPEVFAAP